MAVCASAIVRVKDEAEAIGRALESLRAQTVRPEIIVVDSGSTDGTLEIARRLADRVVEIAPEDFSFGRALNVGARAASAPVHVALSAHCVAHRTDWIERALGHFRDDRVAAAAGATYANGRRLDCPLLIKGVTAGGERGWGFSNHACAWRAAAWQQHPFNEDLVAAEDREWSWRVMRAGWSVVLDPVLWIDHSHQWATVGEAYRRARIAAEALAPFAEYPRQDLPHLAVAWWSDIPVDRHPPFAHRFLNTKRLAGLAGRWVGDRAGRRRG